MKPSVVDRAIKVAQTGDQSKPEWLKIPGRKKTDRRTRPDAILVDARGAPNS